MKTAGKAGAPKQTPRKPERRKQKTIRQPLDTQLVDYSNRDSLQDLQDQLDLGMLEDEPEVEPSPMEARPMDDPNKPETEEDGIRA